MTTEMGVISANLHTPGWKLNSGTGERFIDIYQKFDGVFKKTPKIIVTLSLIDSDFQKNLRITLLARNIDPNSFNLRIQTWADSIIYGINASWIATDDY
jgi:hypothetical protein